MIRTLPLLAALIFAASVLADNPTTVPALSGKLGEPVSLFSGKDMNGWVWVARPPKEPATQPTAKMEEVWSVKDSMLVSKGKPVGYIRTEKQYDNYVLTIEQRHLVKGNGGVLIAITGEDKVWPHCVEVQGASGSMGDFYNQGHLEMTFDPARKDPKDQTNRHVLRIGPNSENPPGEWNTVEVIVDHGTLVAKINGKVQNIGTNIPSLKGAIGLQAEGAPMEFRKVEIRPIE